MKRTLTASMLLIALACFAAPASAQVAPGVTQSEAHTATVTGTVSKSDGSRVAQASVKLIGPAVLTSTSDASGSFIFTTVPWGTYQIVVSSNLGTASRSNVNVNGDIHVAIEYPPPTNNLKTIASVTTTSSGAHINVTAASIASVTPSDYAFQGNPTWQRLLNSIPGVLVNGDLQGGQQIGDFLVGSPITPQVLSINGAMPYETSVTLDGMPLESQTTIGNPGAGYDMAGLPPSAFDTADVVRGPGAHAPSIVDSIGGSMVLHAPGAIQKTSAEFSVSNDPWGGIVSSTKFQGRFGHFSAMVIYGVNDSPGAFGDQRFMSANQSPSTVNGNPVNFTGGSLFCNTGPNTGNTTYFYNFCGQTTTLAYCCVHYSSQWSQHNGAASLAYDVSPNVKAQVFYVGTQSALNGDPFGFVHTQFMPAASYGGQLGPGFYNFMNMNPYQLYQHSSLLEEKITAFIGNGVLRVAALQNNSGTFANHMFGTCLPNGTYTLYGTAQDAVSGNTYTFNGQSASLTFPKIYLTEQFGSHNRDQLVSYDASVGPKTNVGVSYTKSYYNTFNYVPFSYFGSPIMVVCDVNPANSSTLNEYKFNVGQEVGGNVVVNLAWYIARDDFHTQTLEQVKSSPWQDDVFHYTAPRLALTWRPNINTSFRLAAGGGFAVPSLGQLASQSPAAADNCAQNICSTTIANLNLQPEKSFAFDVGSDIRLQRDTVASIDLYRANLFGQYFTANTVGQYPGPPVFGCPSPPCPLYISQTKNLGESRYEGLNFNINHSPVKGMYWSASLGLLRAFLVNVPAGFYTGPTSFASCPPKNPTECTNTELIPGINFTGATQSGIPPVPYAQGAATIGYRWAPRTFIDVAPTYFGNGNGYFEPAFVAWDIHTGYPLSDYTTLYVTMHNVGNIYGDSFATLGVPRMAAPAAIGYPFPLFGIPYGPRSVIVTVNVKT